MKYRAALFDFDGTITGKGVAEPSGEMVQALIELAKYIPIGFCTGRQFDSFERHGLNYLLDALDPGDHIGFLKNVFFLGENGSLGYYYDVKSMGFKEFYRVDWPHDFIDRIELKDKINPLIADYGEFFDAHEVVLVFRTLFHRDPNPQKMYDCANEIYKIIVGFLKNLNPDYEKYVHVGNAGIGVVVGPADGDKDQAIKRFDDFLCDIRGKKHIEKSRDVLIVGDQANYGGNDYYFLNGTFGTPFSVDTIPKGNDYPKPVLDDGGKRLFHDRGTLCLINDLLSNYY